VTFTIGADGKGSITVNGKTSQNSIVPLTGGILFYFSQDGAKPTIIGTADATFKPTTDGGNVEVRGGVTYDNGKWKGHAATEATISNGKIVIGFSAWSDGKSITVQGGLNILYGRGGRKRP
jgi:hypothetical protein